MNLSACLFSASVLLFPVLAFAQDTVAFADSGSIDTMVVTATRRSLPSEWVSDDHAVIDIGTLRQNSSKSVAELIASNIPARLSDNGGGAVKTVSLRGAGSERTLVLVDGKRMGITGGDIGDLSPETIEKIEVVEGGQSAQYGMDAVGGVVNIVTKKGMSEKPDVDVSVTSAMYESADSGLWINTQECRLSFGKKTGNVESFTAADISLSDGRYEFTDSGTTFRRGYNGFMDWGIFQKVGWSLPDFTLNAAVSVRDRRADNPGSLLWPDSGTTKKNISYTALDGSWYASEVMRLKASAAVSYNNIRYEPVSAWYDPSNHAYLNGEAETVQEFTFGKQLLTTGLQGIRQSVSSSDIGYRVAGQGSAFASAVLSRSLAGVVVKAMPAVRFDYSSIFNGALNGRLGLMAALPLAFEPSLFANIGSSFRSPSFDDLYWPDEMGMKGNPDLKRERSFDIDGGIQIRKNEGKVDFSNRVSLFLMRLDDMILWAPLPDHTWSPQNIDKASIAGFKFNSRLRYSTVYDIAFNFVYNNARNRDSNTVLIYRPRFTSVFSSGFSAGRLSAGFVFRSSSEVFTNDANTRSLPSVVTADVNLGIQLTPPAYRGKGLRLVYDVLNVTNKDRMAAEGYPLPKREHRLSCKAGF